MPAAGLQSLSKTLVHYPRPTGHGRSYKLALLTRVNLSAQGSWGGKRRKPEPNPTEAAQPKGRV